MPTATLPPDTAATPRFERYAFVRIGNSSKVHWVIDAHPPRRPEPGRQRREHWLYHVEPAGSRHPQGATRRRHRHRTLYRAEELRAVRAKLKKAAS